MDSPTTRALVSAASWFLEVAAHAEEHLDERGLDAWSVRDLLGHTGRALSTVETYLDAAAGRDVGVHLADAAAYYRSARDVVVGSGAVTERGRAAGAALGEAPLDALRVLAARVLDRVAGASEHARVVTPFGAMTLEGYLPTRVVELTVHTCDLAAAVHLRATVPADAAGFAFVALGALAAADGRAAPVLLALTGRRSLPEGFSLV